MLSPLRLIAALRRRIRRLSDWRFVRWNQLARHQQAWFFRRLLQWQEVDLIIDVGGNAGQFAKFVRALGYRGCIITFEPLPSLAKTLSALASKDGHWHVVQKALGAKEGTASLKVTSTSPMSSLLEPVQDLTSAMAQFSEVRERIDVDVVTLDGFLAHCPAAVGKRNIYLKLDVQGFELAVLEGARQTLANVVAIQTEVGVTSVYDGQTDHVELLAWLRNAGFKPSMFTAHDYELYPEMIDFDAFFIRQDVLRRELEQRQMKRSELGLRRLDE